MKPGRRRAPKGLPMGLMMAEIVVVVAVVLVFGAFQQQSANNEKLTEVASRQASLDRREAELDQRRSTLDQREEALASQAAALEDGQKALAEDRAALDDADDALAGREQALAEGAQALSDDRAALTRDQSALAAREQAFEGQKADYDARLQDYVALQQAVDDVLKARSRIASKLRSAFEAAGVQATVDSDGGASVEVGALFSGSSAALKEDGREALDALLPAWVGALEGESVAAFSVEVFAPAEDSQALDVAGRRALAVLEYLKTSGALTDGARTALSDLGLSGARAAAGGSTRVTFKFYLDNDALRAARAG